MAWPFLFLDAVGANFNVRERSVGWFRRLDINEKGTTMGFDSIVCDLRVGTRPSCAPGRTGAAVCSCRRRGEIDAGEGWRKSSGLHLQADWRRRILAR